MLSPRSKALKNFGNGVATTLCFSTSRTSPRAISVASFHCQS